MPLSSKGLWVALMTTPASAPRSSTSAASPGVGSTPASSTRAAAAGEAGRERGLEHGAAQPRVAADDEARVRGRRAWRRTTAAARPTCTANSGVSRSPATPRMPSVPK